jgi:hypothetical protein
MSRWMSARETRGGRLGLGGGGSWRGWETGCGGCHAHLVNELFEDRLYNVEGAAEEVGGRGLGENLLGLGDVDSLSTISCRVCRCSWRWDRLGGGEIAAGSDVRRHNQLSGFEFQHFSLTG